MDKKEIAALLLSSAVIGAFVSAVITAFAQWRERVARERELLLKVAVDYGGRKVWDRYELIERRFRIGEIILCSLLAGVFLILFVFRYHGTLPLCHRPTFGFHQQE